MNRFKRDAKHGNEEALAYLQPKFPESKFIETKDPFCPWDLETTNQYNVPIIIECKNRPEYTSDRFNNTYIDKTKFEGCLAEVKRRQAAGEKVGFVLCMTYADGVCRLWNVLALLKKGKLRLGQRRCPRTTSKFSGWKLKDVVYFEHSDAYKVLKK